MNLLIKKLLNENGSGLVIVMMVLVVLSALGSTLGMVTINSRRLAEHTQETNSAYYIAEAGANIAYEELKGEVLKVYGNSESESVFFGTLTNPEKKPEVNGTVYKEGVFQVIDGSQPSASIEVQAITAPESKDTFLIRSTGEIAGKTRVVEKGVKVNWVDKAPTVSSSIDLSYALAYNQKLLVNNNNLKITGNLLYPKDSNQNWGNNFEHIGTKETFKVDEYGWWEQKSKINNWLLPIVNNRIKSIDFPGTNNHDLNYNNKVYQTGSIINNKGNINFNSHATVVGDVKTNSGSINFNNQAEITGDIVTNSGDIMINGNATITGNVISNGGKIHFKGQTTVNGDVISTGGEIMFEKGPKVTGSVITLKDGANIKFGNGNTVIEGNVISNGGEMQFANSLIIEGATINPSGKILSHNDTKFNGPVVINDYTVGNGTEITHSTKYLNYFPFNASGGNAGSQGSGGAGEAEVPDLISTKPATEN